jgi:hypothetical protein
MISPDPGRLTFRQAAFPDRQGEHIIGRNKTEIPNAMLLA